MDERWRRAVIQIEGVVDAKSAAGRAEANRAWEADIDFDKALRGAGEDQEAAETWMAKRMADWPPRWRHYQGNALVLRAGAAYLLVTAWSCLHRAFLAAEQIEDEEADRWRDYGADRSLVRAQAVDEWTFPDLIRVAPGVGTDFRTWLSLGPSPVTHGQVAVSSTADLAVATLPPAEPVLPFRFTAGLLAAGVEPVSVTDDIFGEPLAGDSVHTVGYLNDSDFETAIHELRRDRTPDNVEVAGRILDVGVDTFEVEFDQPPGNAGGPVIGDGKLLGIVSPHPTDSGATVVSSAHDIRPLLRRLRSVL